MKTIIHIEPPANMVAWYPGDGNADDIQGGNNGTLHGTATYGQAEVLDGFSFDGNAGQSVVENVGVTFTSRSVVDDRWQEGFSSLVHTFFAIPGPFCFWKEVKTNPFDPNGEHLERKRDHEQLAYFFGEG